MICPSFSRQLRKRRSTHWHRSFLREKVFFTLFLRTRRKIVPISTGAGRSCIGNKYVNTPLTYRKKSAHSVEICWTWPKISLDQWLSTQILLSGRWRHNWSMKSTVNQAIVLGSICHEAQNRWATDHPLRLAALQLHWIDTRWLVFITCHVVNIIDYLIISFSGIPGASGWLSRSFRDTHWISYNCDWVSSLHFISELSATRAKKLIHSTVTTHFSTRMGSFQGAFSLI